MTSTTSQSQFGTTATYTYDGDGKRTKTVLSGQQTDTTNFTWDPNDRFPMLARESNAAGNLKRRYVYGLSTISARNADGSDHYFHYNGIGSVVNVTNGTGATQWTYDYEPFGFLRTETANNPLAQANVLKFTGQLQDTETSYYHLRARQYDASLGRFLTPDPIAQRAADPYVANYIYTRNRPSVLTDPTGEFGFAAVLGPLAAVAGAVSGVAEVVLVVAVVTAAVYGAYELGKTMGERIYHNDGIEINRDLFDRSRTTDERLGGSRMNCRTIGCRVFAGTVVAVAGTYALCSVSSNPAAPDSPPGGQTCVSKP
jgi:RHS repeat-associated protein